jgi:hypothetical protein
MGRGFVDVWWTSRRVALTSRSNTQNLPDQFLLKLPRKLDKWCRLAWRANGEAGVEFIDSPNPGTGDTVKHFVLIQCPRTGRCHPQGAISKAGCGLLSWPKRIRPTDHSGASGRPPKA